MVCYIGNILELHQPQATRDFLRSCKENLVLKENHAWDIYSIEKLKILKSTKFVHWFLKH